MKAFILSFIDRRPRLVLCLLAALFLLPGTPTLPLIDRDEPRFSHATVEMMERGNFIVPYFNDVYRFDKPPLTYWWMSLHYKIFGITELGARFHSVIACGLTALVIFGFARRLLCQGQPISHQSGSPEQTVRWAFLAAFAWLSCLQVMIHGRLALADMPLLLGIILSQWAIWELITAESKPKPFNRWFWALWLGIGLAFLAKGPLAYMPLATLGCTALITRRRLPVGRLQWFTGIPLSLLPVLAWGLPANLMTDWAYWGVGVGEHVVERGTSAFNSRSFVPGFYLLTIFLSLLPWAPFLVKALFRPKSQRDLNFWFLASGLLIPFAVFSFYATQLPHYILPGFPCLFILIARTLQQNPELQGGKIATWFWRILLTLAGLILTISPLTRTGLDPSLLPLVHAVMLLGAMLLTWSVCLGHLAKRNWTIGLPLCLLPVLCFALASGQIRRCHATIRALPVFAEIDAQVPRKVEWHTSGFSEGSIVWYSHRFLDSTNRKEIRSPELDAHPRIVQLRRWRLDDDTFQALLTSEAAPPPVDDHRAEFAPLLQRIPPKAILQGFNPATSSWIEFAILPPANDLTKIRARPNYKEPEQPNPAD